MREPVTTLSKSSGHFIDQRAIRPTHPGNSDKGLGSLAYSLAIAMQIQPTQGEPAHGLVQMRKRLANECPETRSMIHLGKMGDLVGGHVIQNMGRREHQAP